MSGVRIPHRPFVIYIDMNSPEVLNLFTVPLLKYSIPNWESVKKRLVRHLPKDKYTDFYDSEDNSAEYITVFGESIQDIMMDYSNMMGNPAFVSRVWYERSKKGDSHNAHNHGATGYSGVLYVNFDSQQHKGTKFYSPFFDPNTGDLLECVAEVEEGDLVLFPSYLLHEATVNESEIERIIISFNIMGHDSAMAYRHGLMGYQMSKDLENQQV